tara:strand:+ start:18730 stop:18879 length:150 start_codon:yes stop_codon:yes gene_type:complete
MKKLPAKAASTKTQREIRPANRMIWGSKMPHHVTSRKIAEFPYRFAFFS